MASPSGGALRRAGGALGAGTPGGAGAGPPWDARAPRARVLPNQMRGYQGEEVPACTSVFLSPEGTERLAFPFLILSLKNPVSGQAPTRIL